jgi:hypothetical protein
MLLVAFAACRNRVEPGSQPAATSSSLAAESSSPAVAAALSSDLDDPSLDEPDGAALGELDAAVQPEGGDPRFADLPTRSVQLNGSFKIAAKALQAWVHMYPDDETTYLGYLRTGTVVDRSENPIVRTKRCRGGWYEVLPRGYLCAGRRATLDVQDPVVVASWKKPLRGEPLPYRYVRPGEPPPYLYFTLPSMKDQLRTEGPGLKEHLAIRAPDRIPNVEVLGPAESIPEFLAPGKQLPNPYGSTQRLRYRVQEGKANPQAAFALLSVHQHEGRLFGLTTDLDLLAIDRTKIVRPPSTHGGPVDGLPAGIVLSHNTPRFLIEDDAQPKKDGFYDRRQVLGLTGKGRGNLVQTLDGHWVSGSYLRILQPRSSFPSFATESRKWIDVSIKEQLLIAYIGTKAVYAAFVSTGLGELSDPAKTFATVRGAFTIKSKHVTATMTGSAQADYELADVPYVQYFHEGYALHGAFWHDDFGRVHSHGCINLPPIDAAWLFEWTDPAVPPDWHGANSTAEQPGTILYIHP